MAGKLLEEMELARQEIKRLKLSLRAEKLRTKISSEYTDFGLWEYDIESDICYQYKKLSGRYEDNLEPIVHFRDSIISWGIVCTEDLPAFNRFCDAMERGDKELSCEIRAINDNCDVVWLRYEGKTVFDNGKPIKVIGRTIDITDEKKELKSELGKRDALTGLYTPELFRDCVGERRSGVNRYCNAALLSIGIDDFRVFAAKNGAEYSDYIQITVSKILEGISACEHDSIVTRLRDGEFVMYLSFTDLQQLDKTARRIVNTVKNYVYDGEPVTASVGISVFKGGRKSEEVYKESAVALAEAYKSGGACFMHYSMTMSERSYYGIPTETESGLGSSIGAAKIYDFIIRAFCSEKDRSKLMKSAFVAAGQYLGASNVYIYNREGENFCRYMAYNSSDKVEEECPCVVQNCSDSDLSDIFGSQNKLRLHSAEKIKGLSLSNGANCAELRAIRCRGEIAEYFAIVFESSFELSESDIHIIDELADALTEIYHSYIDNKREFVTKRLHSTIINDHRIEGFSIIPGKFIVDTVGENAREHYGMRPGDVCYKKMRGFDEPCANCPALQLDSTGKLFASSAYYDENERRWLDVAASVEETANGERRYIISSTDITDCLGKIQMADSLTGVMTFDVFSAEAMRITTSENSEGGYVAVINVADFRRINEEKGFEMGNSILITIAEILRRCTGSGELVGRSEGSRFAALFKNSTTEEFVSRLTLMLNSIQKQIYIKFQIQIYLLAGVCDMNDDPVGFMGALDRAITAQKTVKDRAYYSENLIAFYDGALREKIKERRFVEANMMHALENDEFHVYYQPKVNIDTGKVVGAEALVRWIRPDGTMISPGKFVPIFEQNGFISEMDFAIYKGALKDIRKWLDEGIDMPLISLNVSRRHLADDNFCKKLNDLVDGVGVPHSLIELEITESLLTENLNKLIETVTWFKEKGFRISIDDFGSGYSSLNLITMLPFDTLKIDGGFFLKNDLTDKNKKVISSVVTLAKSLNLETVSEGVETQVQVDFLRDLGCDMIQGFFYYRPMPAEDFHEILLAQTESAKLM